MREPAVTLSVLVHLDAILMVLQLTAETGGVSGPSNTLPKALQEAVVVNLFTTGRIQHPHDSLEVFVIHLDVELSQGLWGRGLGGGAHGHHRSAEPREFE